MGMNYRTRREATVAGKKLLARMRGEGWKLRVWENLGWHISVSSGPISVYEYVGLSGNRYHALVSDEPNTAGWGAPFWGAAYVGRDPNRVVGRAVKQVEKVVTRHRDVLRAFWRATGETFRRTGTHEKGR